MTPELVPVSVVPVTEDWVPVLVDPNLPAFACRSSSVSLHHGEAIVVETPDG